MDKVKKERKLSNWQFFLKDCIPQQEKGKSMPEKMTLCSVNYNTLKDKDPDTLEKIVEKQTKILEAKKKEERAY